MNFHEFSPTPLLSRSVFFGFSFHFYMIFSGCSQTLIPPWLDLFTPLFFFFWLSPSQAPFESSRATLVFVLLCFLFVLDARSMPRSLWHETHFIFGERRVTHRLAFLWFHSFNVDSVSVFRVVLSQSS